MHGEEDRKKDTEKVIFKIFKDVKELKKDKSKKGYNIFYLEEYHPRRGGMNPLFDENSQRILDVKEQKPEAVKHFIEKIKNILSGTEEFVICVMPSSRKGTKPSGIRTIAKSLCYHHIIDGTGCLYRINDALIKKSLGGKRDFEDEIKSIGIKNENIIKDKIVLLLDDITTSGNSLKSGICILKKVGAEEVIALALGKTRN